MNQRFLFCCTLFSTLIISSLSELYSQEAILKGKIVDEKTDKVVGYASILNYSRHLRLYSNTAGDFSIMASAGDTLVFYAVGYYYQKVIASGEMMGNKNSITIALRPQVYDIAEARILGLGNYDQFRNQFVQLEREKTQTEILNESIATISRAEAVESYNMTRTNQKLSSGSVSMTIMSVPILTPQEKERIKLTGIIQKEKVNDLIYAKFNPEIVKNITGLSNDDDIIEFMIFCDFSDEYLLEVNEYVLMEAVSAKFELFKKRKEELKKMHNRIEESFDGLKYFS